MKPKKSKPAPASAAPVAVSPAPEPMSIPSDPDITTQPAPSTWKYVAMSLVSPEASEGELFDVTFEPQPLVREPWLAHQGRKTDAEAPAAVKDPVAFSLADREREALAIIEQYRHNLPPEERAAIAAILKRLREANMEGLPTNEMEALLSWPLHLADRELATFAMNHPAYHAAKMLGKIATIRHYAADSDLVRGRHAQYGGAFDLGWHCAIMRLLPTLKKLIKEARAVPRRRRHGGEKSAKITPAIAPYLQALVDDAHQRKCPSHIEACRRIEWFLFKSDTKRHANTYGDKLAMANVPRPPDAARDLEDLKREGKSFKPRAISNRTTWPGKIAGKR